MGRESKKSIRNPERHYGYMTLRQSKYPVEVNVDGHTVYLNPLKRMIKGEPYKNKQYQEEMNRVVREYAMKMAQANKAKEDGDA